MKILCEAFGEFGTNCYIADLGDAQIIIDPGDGAFEFVKKNCQNPVAILNTHGHFDHIFDDLAIKNHFKIPVYIPKDDAFMCEKDPFNLLKSPFTPDFLVGDNESINLGGANFCFHHFPGHSPGCSVITIDETMFSGDFIFCGSIGRYDFPFSSASAMKSSLERVLGFGDFELFPGHGPKTTLEKERPNLARFISYL